MTTNFKEISKFTPQETIKFFAEKLKDEPVFEMREILTAIKEDAKLSSLQVLDEFGERFAKRIDLAVDFADWNSWVAKLHHAKKAIENDLQKKDEEKRLTSEN